MRQDNSNMVINYTVRPCKNVERKMMCELISALGEILPITDETTRYIGMGAKFFADFSLVHRMFGLKEMYSIEKSSASEDIYRFEFNKPFKCIRMVFQNATDYLRSTKFPQKDKRNIIWLDYDGGFTGTMLQDVNLAVKKSAPLSLLFTSVNIDFGERYSELSPKDRLQKFIDRVKNENYTKYLTAKDLAGDGRVKTVVKMFNFAIEDALIELNTVNQEENLQCKQIACFKYADSRAEMLTIGWVICHEPEWEQMKDGKVSNLDFFNEGDEPYDISVPPLTTKEIAILNKNLPDIEFPLRDAPFLTENEVNCYSKIYRYYPAFAESDLII